MSDIKERPGRKYFCPNHFLIKITSRSFLAWLFSNVSTFIILLRNIDFPWMNYMIIGNIIITILYIGGKTIVDAIAEATRKAEIKVDL